MDAFYASVEVRDDSSLKGKPVIIGARPTDRGVVATCSYEAREYGVHSAMNIKEAYRLCPDGVYLQPNFEKYRAVSEQLHRIWAGYATALESVALDEAYLDVTETAGSFEKAREFAQAIKQRTRDELGLSCSVGLAYSMMAAKTASEEMKPNGYFEIRGPAEFQDLVIDRDVSVLHSVGSKTAEKLKENDISTVRDILDRQEDVRRLFGNQGDILIQIAQGIDERKVTTVRPEDAKSISRGITFQEDVLDVGLLRDVLLLLSVSVAERAKRYDLKGTGVVLKVTYSDMTGITRSKTTKACDNAIAIRDAAVEMLSSLKMRPIRLIGVGIFNLTGNSQKQMTLDEMFGNDNNIRASDLSLELDDMKRRYEYDFKSSIRLNYRDHSLHQVIEHMRVYRITGRPIL